ncbi:MAG: hypothetical protein HPY94_03680 [Clostridia bacterium]|nr:hypothetical protein [Clostridia bacterium]
MDKYTDNSLVEPMDAIILLNDNYSRAGLKKGYIGVVVDNLIKSQNIILVDFFNPMDGKDIAVLAQIKKDDFRVISSSPADQRAVRAFKNLFA